MSDRGRNRVTQPGTATAGPWLLVAVLLLVAAAVFGSYVALVLGHKMAGLPPVRGGLTKTLQRLIHGRAVWPVESTIVLAAMVAVVLAIAVAILLAVVKRRRRSTRVDWAARVLGAGREIESLRTRHVTASAKAFGVTGTPGILLGRTVAAPREPLRSTWEDVGIVVAGPRVGKSTCYAVPAIIDAPGAVLATSNKRDLVDATRDVRAKDGSEVWVFDPQRLVDEPPRWWWNPLTFVTDEVKAATLADHFATDTRAAGAKGDAYFDGAGKNLLAGLFLAAALGERPITEVYRWLTRPDDDEPVKILERHDKAIQADNVAAMMARTDKQRDGIYGTAQQMAEPLTFTSLHPWITNHGPYGDARRRHFDAAEFVRQGGTLHSLSKEGVGSTGALVTALTNAVLDEAEEQAKHQRGGRLGTPMVGVLDEVANICRWRTLPDLYSHYGSRGINLWSFFQSWAQGVLVWGEQGMSKLWSSANHKVYLGNNSELPFLRMLSELIGPYDKLNRSSSTRAGEGWMGGSVSTNIDDKASIFTPADLHAFPKGRAVLLSSGSRPTIVETQPWMKGPRADEIAASVKAHDPEAERTLYEAAAEMAQVEADLSSLTHEELR